MCGIGGIVGGEEPDRAVLERMAAAMAHRGPDGEGFYLGAGAGLAFRRLAIIDLHERSNQPMALGPWRLVLNGEIYNYVELRDELRGRGHAFVTEGDAEVLLHAWDEWGEGALARLNGMFAFAIWHEDERRLILASDPFGEKPLYWWHGDDRLVFASDIPAIFAALTEAPDPAPEAVAAFLAFGWMPPIDKSFFSGIHRLPAAHLLRWRDNRTEVVRYWTPQEVEVPRRLEDAAAQLRELLLDSVRLRLRSDVPVGTSLSGGVDSSTIVSLCGRLAESHVRHAFTASFPGFARDETAFAEAVARSAGVTQHHLVTPTTDEVFADLEDVVRDQQEPFQSLSIYAQWRVMRAASDAGIVVLLDGQGADELFGGYESIRGYALRSMSPAAAVREVATGSYARRDILLAGAAGLPKGLRRRLRTVVRGRSRRTRVDDTSPYAAAEVRQAAARLDLPELAHMGRGSTMRKELLRETFHTSLPTLLRYADRDSMAHSREVRLPFLDRRVAEFALSLPVGFLVRRGGTKHVLREATRGVVPAAILDRRDKVGFEPPQAVWLASPQGLALARDVLLDDSARARGLYDLAAIEEDLRTGAWRDQAALWRAIALELWFVTCAESQARTPAVAV